MKFRSLSLITHIVSASLAAVIVSVAVLTAPFSWALLACAMAFVVPVVASVHVARRVEHGLKMFEQAATKGEGRGDSQIAEFNQVSQVVSDYSQRLMEMATNSREQSREINALLSELDRRSDRRGNKPSVNAGNELRLVLQSHSNAFDNQLKEIVEHAVEIESCTADITADCEDQTGNANKASSVCEQLSAAVEKLSSHSTDVRKTSEQTVQFARAGQNEIQSLTDGIATIQRLAENGGKRLSELNDRTNEVGSLVDTLSAIASRTDLLALNASIESVRAGENGRGFAIVAEEIRKLAEQATSATEEVSGLIDSIRAETRESLTVVAREQDELLAESGRINKVQDVLKKIGEASHTSTDSLGDIDAAVEHQLSLTEQIAATVQRILDSAKTNRSRSEQATWKITNLTNTSREFDQALEPLRGDTDQRKSFQPIDSTSRRHNDMSGGEHTARTGNPDDRRVLAGVGESRHG